MLMIPGWWAVKYGRAARAGGEEPKFRRYKRLQSGNLAIGMKRNIEKTIFCLSYPEQTDNEGYPIQLCSDDKLLLANTNFCP